MTTEAAQSSCMTESDRRELGLLAAVAVWGLAAGITLATLAIGLTLFAVGALWMSVGHAALIAAAILCVGRLIRGPFGLKARRYTLAYFLYPVFAIALFAGDLTPRVNLFEDGHSLLPASEMLHGKRLYRDIVPGHGLVGDGVIDWA